MKSRVKSKSRGKRKAGVRAKAKAPASRKGAKPRVIAAKPRAAAVKPQPLKANALDQWIVASVAELGLRVEKSWMQAVRTNLRVTLDQAAAVAEFPLPDDAEPAPVYRA